jgi:hypothetical protein
MAYIGSGISRFNTADELTVTGDAEFNGNANFGDNDKAIFGAGSDMQIWHDGSNSIVYEGGTGTLKLATAGGSVDIVKGSDSSETMAKFNINGAAELYHDNAKKFETTATGISVTGTATATTFQANAGGTFTTASGNDLNIVYPDSRSLFIKEGSTTHVTVDNAGNVGIGTAVPAHNVEIVATNAGSVNDSLQIRNNATSSGTGSRIRFINSTDNTSDTNGASISSVRNGDDNDLVFETENAERMRIDSSGSLLAGKTAADSIPTDGIEIDGPNGRVLITRDGNEPLILNRKTSDGIIVDLRKDGTTVGSIGTIGGDMVAGTGDTGLRFHDGADQVYPSNTNGSGRDAAIDLGNSGARFKDGYFAGNIRTDSTLFAPSFTCYPNGSAPTADAAIYRPQDGTLGFVSNGSEKARFASDGNLYIAKTSDTATGVGLTLSGGGFIRAVRNEICGVFNRQGSDGTLLSFARSNSGVGAISVTTSATTYSTSSDRRLKSNIQDAASASAKIDAIQVRQFDWNADDSHQDYGLIAQELQPIAPMAVSGNADSDEMMGVDYSKLVPMLIKEIQELRSRVATLEAN